MGLPELPEFFAQFNSELEQAFRRAMVLLIVEAPVGEPPVDVLGITQMLDFQAWEDELAAG